jgi:hypothetical protein
MDCLEVTVTRSVRYVCPTGWREPVGWPAPAACQQHEQRTPGDRCQPGTMGIEESANEREPGHEVREASNEVISAVQDPHQGRKGEGGAQHDGLGPGMHQSS